MAERKAVGFACGDNGCQPLTMTDAEVDALVTAVDEAKQRRLDAMPDDAAALRVLHDAHTRLMELGWRNAMYCPKDGTVFEVIEAGSTGIHDCIYRGDWPKGGWWILDDGDMCPSRPILFRLKPDSEPADAGA